MWLAGRPASAEIYIRSALFWDVYAAYSGNSLPVFRTTYRPHLHGPEFNTTHCAKPQKNADLMNVSFRTVFFGAVFVTACHCLPLGQLEAR